MLKSWKVRIAILCSIAVAFVLMSVEEKPAEARPQYLKQFMGNYKKLEKQAKMAKCNVCHYGKSKKNRNDYGKQLAELFGKNKKKKNVKDEKVIKEVFKKAEKEKSSEKDKTFGDLLKDGKLPGKAPKEDDKE